MKIYNKIFFLVAVAALSVFSVATSAATHKTLVNVPQANTSQQQVATKLVETYYNALNEKNMTLFFSVIDNNVIHDINQADTEQGIKKFKAFMQASNNSFDEKLNDVIIMTSQDGTYAAARWIDKGVYFKTYPGLGIAANNQHYTLAGGHFFEIHNGKIQRITTYYNATDFIRQIKQSR